ncbi:chromosome partitioning protein [Methanocella sp. CWC-04]|uniref:Chromosome partitioning protein n=1 Tax=Methanooceanicella nereidis TaxID=2052831 RepID=A0AAP2RCK0_9EURY|nr:ParB/RepB/Spo0J family partition protein [Methanocella sp. CWC-04]MCD1294918.1 chromosome partitioning protein [Methanocella sp. CWC-04]
MGGRTKPAKPVFETISIDSVRQSEDHIRKTFSKCTNLTATISDVGLLQPILVCRSGNGYEVIDGARRLEALKDLGISELIVGKDVIVAVDETEADARFKQIIANIQREDINDIELGHAFVTLKESFDYQYNEIAEIIGKTPHYVAAKVGLAKRLTKEVQELFVSDIESAKCIQNTLSCDDVREPPYVMNVNIIEDIARLPAELQRPAYDAICARKMDKNEALSYLRSLKRDAEVLKLADDVKGLVESYSDGDVKNAPDKELKRYLKKIDRDLDKLATRVSVADPAERENIKPVLESLIQRLSSLYAEVNAGEAESCGIEA